jgi:hypothetical protein
MVASNRVTLLTINAAVLGTTPISLASAWKPKTWGRCG